MYIERKIDPMTEKISYVKDGDKEIYALNVFVNDKRVAADIIALDDKEGWVDIELPIIKNTETITNESKEILLDNTKIPTHDITVKRLVGKVHVITK